MNDMNDRDLQNASTQDIVRRIQAGESDLFRVLHDRYFNRLRFLARCRMPRRLRSKLDSIDLVQSAFKEAVVHIDEFRNCRSDGLFLNWLSRAMINNLKNKIAHYDCKKADIGREEAIEAGGTEGGRDIPADAPGVVSVAGMLEDLERLETVLDDLQDNHREVLLLRWFCDMSWEEVGLELGCTPGAAKQRELRAQASLVVKWSRRFGRGPHHHPVQ